MGNREYDPIEPREYGGFGWIVIAFAVLVVAFAVLRPLWDKSQNDWLAPPRPPKDAIAHRPHGPRWLTCDAAYGIDRPIAYDVKVDDGAWERVVGELVEHPKKGKGIRLKYDVSKLPDGEHTIQVKSVNEQGESVPVGIRLEVRGGGVYRMLGGQNP